jgi:hypothetical protein
MERPKPLPLLELRQFVEAEWLMLGQLSDVNTGRDQ